MSTGPRAAHVAAASVNQTVGDWSGNVARIRAALDEARRRGARLVLLPELAISGYSLGDRLSREGTLQRSWMALEAIRVSTQGLVAFVGLPIRHRGVLFNAVACVADGRIVGLSAKENLATGDVQYENRWYAGWPRGVVETFRSPSGAEVPIGALVYDVAGVGRVAVEVCEDAWKGLRPGSIAALAGAEILLNASASWFVLGKHAARRRMIEQISAEDLAVYLFASLHGCDATRLVFDGTLLVCQNGDTLGEGRRFRFHEEFEILDRVVDLDQVARARMEEGSWRQQVEALYRGEYGPLPRTVRVEGDFGTDSAPPPPAPYWERGTVAPHTDPSLQWLVDEGLVRASPVHGDLPYLELELALAGALGEYVAKAGLPGVALALSGGRDSTMVALLVHRMLRLRNPGLDDDAVRALCREQLVCVWMETEHSSDATRAAARAVAEEVGATFLAGGIQDLVDTNVARAAEMLGHPLTWAEHDVPLQNVQARVRGALVWLVANVRGLLLLTTSNKSEAAVGYATMDGDTAGGLAPIADVPKSLVTAWLRWARSFHGYASIEHVLSSPASAELRPLERSQTDEADLMPFAVLDQLMDGFVQRGQAPLELFRTLWPGLASRYGGDARAFAAHVEKFVRMLCFAQWKRERFAISFRVTAFDLDPKTGFRFPPVQAPFTEELAEMWAHVDALPSATLPE